MVLQTAVRRCYKGMVTASMLPASAERFDDLFEREYSRVVSIAYRILRDEDEAHDVAQEVFIRASRLGTRARSGWLYTAAAHVALNAVRARVRREARELRRLRFRGPDAPDESAEDPQRIVERAEEQRAVCAALLRIAPGEAAILALRYGGCAYREVAEALRISPNQVGVRLARAERSFKRELERGTP